MVSLQLSFIRRSGHIFAYRLERLIPDTTGFLAILIMACAFLLSFANLQAGAIQAGITPGKRLHRCSPDYREPDDSPIFASAGVHPVRVDGGCYVFRGEYRG